MQDVHKVHQYLKKIKTFYKLVVEKIGKMD